MPTVDKTNLVLNGGVAVDYEDAASSTINQVEVFTLTPGKDNHSIIAVRNRATDQGSITASIAAGDFWAGAAAAKVVTIAQGTVQVIQLDGARYKQDDGTISVTLTPASGKRLATDHLAGVALLVTQ